jgi:hypothetical protein
MQVFLNERYHMRSKFINLQFPNLFKYFFFVLVLFYGDFFPKKMMVIFFVYILELDAHAECQEAID